MKSTYCPNLTSFASCKVKRIFLSLGLVLIALMTILPAPDLHAEFNKHEIKIMTENIEETFKLLVDTWNEELYFEMYDFGQRESQQRITRSEFAQRMVELKWRPTLTPIEIDRVDILYLNYAVIYFWQEFENKVNVLRKNKKYMIFPVILENNAWKFDLTQLIRIPYEGTFEKPESLKEIKPVEKSAAPVKPEPPGGAVQVPQAPAGNP